METKAERLEEKNLTPIEISAQLENVNLDSLVFDVLQDDIFMGEIKKAVNSLSEITNCATPSSLTILQVIKRKIWIQAAQLAAEKKWG